MEDDEAAAAAAAADEQAIAASLSLPFADRVADKNWKIRKAAFDDAKTACEKVKDPQDPILSDYGAGCVLPGTLNESSATLAKHQYREIPSSRAVLSFESPPSHPPTLDPPHTILSTAPELSFLSRCLP